MVRDHQKRVDEFFMRLAIAEALRGLGWTSPNPLVGCVVVRDGRVVARGAHLMDGKTHAERNAIDGAVDAGRGEELKGATLYVNLEPCSHHGRTPPCTEAIIEAGIGRVVWGEMDTDARSAARARSIFEDAGIAVTDGVLAGECRALNERFHHGHRFDRPFVALKIAQSLDGRIALANGNSKWITCDESREHVQILRQTYDAVLVGSGTVRTDDPKLTVRRTEFGKGLGNLFASLKMGLLEELREFRAISGSGTGSTGCVTTTRDEVIEALAGIEAYCLSRARSPVAVLLDTKGTLTPALNVISARIASGDGREARCRSAGGNVVVATSRGAFGSLKKRFEKNPTVKVFEVGVDGRGFVEWDSLWKSLYDLGIGSVLVEGGSAVWTDLIKRSIKSETGGGKETISVQSHPPDKIYLFVSPRVLGDDSIPVLGNLNLGSLQTACGYTIERVEKSGSDILIVCSKQR